MKITRFRFFVLLALAINIAFLVIMTTVKTPYSLKQLWPVMAVITGVALFITGRQKPHKKIVLAYDFPSVVFVVLGIVCLLFSTGVIKISIRHIALMAAPVVLVVAGVFLVLLYYKRREILEILPPDIKDDIMENSD